MSDLLLLVVLILFATFGWLFFGILVALTPAWAFLKRALTKKPLVLMFGDRTVRYAVPERVHSRGLIVKRGKTRLGYIKTPESAYYDGKGIVYVVDERVGATVPVEAVEAMEEVKEGKAKSVWEAAKRTLRPSVVFDFLSNLAPEHIMTIVSAELEAEKRLLGSNWQWLVWVGVFVLMMVLAYQIFVGGIDYARISQAVAEGVAKALKAGKVAKDVNAVGQVVVK